MNCIHCQSEAIVKNGTKTLKTGQVLQQYLCNTCGRRFNERSGTPMARLRAPSPPSRWPSMPATKDSASELPPGSWAPPPAISRPGKSAYRLICPIGPRLPQRGARSPSKAMNSTPAWVRTFPPEASQGWTISFIERESRYWLEASAGLKEAQLFEQGVQRAWQWAQPSAWIRWFTDGERRYGKELWKLASVYLPSHFTSDAYPYRKVWREGLEVAIKIKGSQGQPRVEWLNVEHPWTALSAIAEVHANHLEAFNSALRRRATAYRRRQNHYAKQVEGLQRALDVQRLMHNWVRPHWSLGKQTTPAMAMGFIQRPLKLSEILVSRGLQSLTL
jgi:hypothetical protein